jgi:hypothetical protein
MLFHDPEVCGQRLTVEQLQYLPEDAEHSRTALVGQAQYHDTSVSSFRKI